MESFANLTYYIHTFGCQMNVRESESAAGILQAMSMREAASIQQADVILFNTCCIRDLAERKAFGAIGAAKQQKLERPHVRIGVFGCMVAQPGMEEEIKRRFPFVDFAFGTNSLHLLPQLLKEAMADKQIYRVEIGDARLEFDLPVYHQTPPLAFVNIIHGCNNFCTYCIVPYVRGREKSRPMDLIVQEVETLVAQGYREVTLLGQNVNSYGKDCGTSFAALLRRLDATGIDRIRFMTSHPKDLTDELIEAMADSQHVCRHIHLPVQSGSSRILQKMNRRYDAQHYLRLVHKLRAAMPEIGITTDIIAGFPGETQQDHAETLALLEEVQFDAAFMFAFSPRRGTPAASMPQAVPEAVKKQRLQEIIDLQQSITQRIQKQMVGQRQYVLVEHASKRNAAHMTGKNERNRSVNFAGSEALIGQIVPVKIVRANVNSLFGQLCE